jgi:uncharacterized protein YbjT (DUF2867 family)
MRVLILGATGRVGQWLLTHLPPLFPEASWVGTSRTETVLPYVRRFHPFTDDWSTLGTFDVVINAAGAVPESDHASFSEVHVLLPRLLTENRHLIGMPRILHFSALHADPSHPIGFLRTKGQGDEILSKQPEVLLLKPAIICFPDALLVRKLKKLLALSKYFLGRAPLPNGFLDTKIQPIAPEDIVAVVAKAIKERHLPQSLDIVGADTYTFGELIQLLARNTAQPFIGFPIPNTLVGAVTKNFISIWFPGLVQYDEFQLGLKDQVADVSPLEHFLGHTVQFTLTFWEKTTFDE